MTPAIQKAALFDAVAIASPLPESNVAPTGGLYPRRERERERERALQ
jgi:hypothetical protein